LTGSNFEKPKAKTIRQDRKQGGAKLFERSELLAILDVVDVQMRAMILLALNGGLGNSDLAGLRESNIQGEWLDFPRIKTAIDRRIPLWPETITALKAALAIRRPPADPADRDLVFLTQKQGRRWVRMQVRKGGDPTEPRDMIPLDALTQKFKKILRKLGINSRRGLGFYSLRHNFETIAGECRDQVAVNAIMGHVDSSMSANYRHGVSDERLQAAVNAVRTWLFAS
jgi:integrase